MPIFHACAAALASLGRQGLPLARAWLYFAVAPFPIYTPPHLLKPLVHRRIGLGRGGLPGPDRGVRRSADE